MERVNLTINGKSVTAPKGSTILEAAESAGIRIPTLCFYKGLEPGAGCGLCEVEAEDFQTPLRACAFKVREGMVIRTDTDALQAGRKLRLQKLLSRHPVDCDHCLRIGSSKWADFDPKFCETCFFCDCVREGFCELQALAHAYGIDVLPFEIIPGDQPLDATTAIVRNPNKCIDCRRCVKVCNQVQTVNNLKAVKDGVALVSGATMAESDCVGCGRCVQVCPTGALFAREHKDELVCYAHRDGVRTAAAVSAALIPELERVLHLAPGSVTLGEIVGALKKIGVDTVFDTAEAEDAARAQAEKLLDEKLGQGKPVILTNSFAARAFLEKNYPDKQDSFLFYDSALAVFGRAAGDYDKRFAFGPVGGDAAECEKTRCVDIAVNARELARIMIRTGSEPHPGRTAEADKLGLPASAGRCSRLLGEADWNMGFEPERFEENGLRCVICHNLGQARRALAETDCCDVIRVIA